jgi:hypothetical protein
LRPKTLAKTVQNNPVEKPHMRMLMIASTADQTPLRDAGEPIQS